ncbi:MAG: hypothetical protein KKA19_00080, partial [Candidatus Margulisbacteria bacterium]|nr:hypothetical protein [Candidatus Margulisiibacteriota bacterium]
MSQAYIYIPVWQNLNDVNECISAIKKNTIYNNYQLTLIDDSNTPYVSKQLEFLGQVIKNKTNQGFTKSINTARNDFLKKAAKNDFFIILN